MNYKLKFVAMIVLGGALLTGCLKNEESEGVKDVRGAHAALLNAQAAKQTADAALVTASAEYKRAEIALVEVQVAAGRLANRLLEVDVKMAEGTLEAELRTALQQELAKLETAKAALVAAQVALTNAKAGQYAVEYDYLVAKAEFEAKEGTAEKLAQFDEWRNMLFTNPGFFGRRATAVSEVAEAEIRKLRIIAINDVRDIEKVLENRIARESSLVTRLTTSFDLVKGLEGASAAQVLEKVTEAKGKIHDEEVKLKNAKIAEENARVALERAENAIDDPWLTYVDPFITVVRTELRNADGTAVDLPFDEAPRPGVSTSLGDGTSTPLYYTYAFEPQNVRIQGVDNAEEAAADRLKLLSGFVADVASRADLEDGFTANKSETFEVNESWLEREIAWFNLQKDNYNTWITSRNAYILLTAVPQEVAAKKAFDDINDVWETIKTNYLDGSDDIVGIPQFNAGVSAFRSAVRNWQINAAGANNYTPAQFNTLRNAILAYAQMRFRFDGYVLDGIVGENGTSETMTDITWFLGVDGNFYDGTNYDAVAILAALGITSVEATLNAQVNLFIDKANGKPYEVTLLPGVPSVTGLPSDHNWSWVATNTAYNNSTVGRLLISAKSAYGVDDVELFNYLLKKIVGTPDPHLMDALESGSFWQTWQDAIEATADARGEVKQLENAIAAIEKVVANYTALIVQAKAAVTFFTAEQAKFAAQLAPLETALAAAEKAHDDAGLLVAAINATIADLDDLIDVIENAEPATIAAYIEELEDALIAAIEAHADAVNLLADFKVTGDVEGAVTKAKAALIAVEDAKIAENKLLVDSYTAIIADLEAKLKALFASAE